MSPERRARAARIGPYFEVQLRLARRMAELTGRPLGEIALQHTNLHRRFGLGVWREGPPAPGWTPFAAALEARTDLIAQAALAKATFAAAPDEDQPQPGQRLFGCFAHEPPGEDRAVRIHFYNLDTDDEGGPLARGKISRRTAELRAMTAHVRAAHPEAKAIRGASWLYNTEAYRRLFPSDYVDSRKPKSGPIPLTGTSSWGQLIDSREAIRPDVRDALLANLDRLDPAAPWRVFPHQVLAVSAPVESFAEFYGLGA
jgi:hypothetical protein